MDKIVVNDLNKVIKGRTILHGISYTFQSGTIYGFHGRNGSGKTMLLRAIAGLIIPTSGEVIIDGKILGKELEFPESMGIIIENMCMLPDYSAFHNLKILAKIKKIATEEDIYHALKLVGLDPDSKQKVKEFSLGMKQKLNIAQAIFENPDILLLDEPTNALDEEAIQMVRRILIEKKKENKTILIASHNKEDLNVLVDKVIEIVDGTITKEDTKND